jgi:ubiquinone/menaquinone biosynthesis C-methylase UbiE
MPKPLDHVTLCRNWSSYDHVSSTYEELLTPCYFLPPATDLLVLLDLRGKSRVLDVGTGTGTAARLVAESLGSNAFVVGVDPSFGMLQVAKRQANLRIVAAQVPGLPFREGAFDLVIANFVISHVDRYETALLDMVQVLKSGGKLGLTAWGNNHDEFRITWQEVAESFVRKDVLAAAVRRAIPWEDRFRDPDRLRQALGEVGLQSIILQEREYKVRMGIAEYLAGKEISMQARFMRQTIDQTSWQEFRKRVSEVFADRYRDPVEYTNVAFLAVGWKP